MKKIVWKVEPFFTDTRGTISHLLPEKMKITGAILITCKKGAIRANHFHKKDTHYTYLISGKMEYTYKDMEAKNARKKKIIVYAGDIVATFPMTGHAMKFLEPSVFIALTTEEREQAKYEKDTVRIPLIEG